MESLLYTFLFEYFCAHFSTFHIFPISILWLETKNLILWYCNRR